MARPWSIVLRGGGALIVLLGLTLALWASPASAAGNAALAKFIISDPYPHGVAAPAGEVSAYTAQLQKVENAIASGLNGVTVSVAAQGWESSPGSKKDLTISLIALKQNGVSTSTTNKQTAVAASTGAVSFCEGGTGSGPLLDKPVPGIPNSHFAVCSTVKGKVPEVITTSRANVFAIIETTTSSFNPSQFKAIALRQYDALSTNDVALTSTNTGLLIGSVVGGVGIVVAIVVVVLLVRRDRRRRRNAPPLGWYFNSALPGQLWFWNGVEWAPASSPAQQPYGAPPPPTGPPLDPANPQPPAPPPPPGVQPAPTDVPDHVATDTPTDGPAEEPSP